MRINETDLDSSAAVSESKSAEGLGHGKRAGRAMQHLERASPEDVERQALITEGKNGSHRVSCLAYLRSAYDLQTNLVSITLRPGTAIKCLDGLRAWALCWVIAFHCIYFVGVKDPFRWQEPSEAKMTLMRFLLIQPIMAGDMGVDIFFVLSGYLVCHILLKEYNRNGERIRITRYLINRWIRLFPAMLVSMLVSSVHPNVRRLCVRWGWTNLIFINNFIGPQVHVGCLGHTWSVAVECQFYAVTPFLIPLLVKHSWRMPLVGCLLCLFFNAVLMIGNSDQATHYIPPADVLYDKPYTRCTPYLCGMLVAYAHQEGWAPPMKLRVVCNCVFSGLWICLSFLGAGNTLKAQDPPLFNALLIVASRSLFGVAVAYVLFMMLSGHFRLLNQVLSWDVWVPLARLSYSAYLFQFSIIYPVLPWVYLDGVTTSYGVFFFFLVMTLLTHAGSLLWGFVIYMLVEKPCMNLRLL